MDPLLDYYSKVLGLKKKFVKSLEHHCSRKREIYKIWAHWLIRILSKKKVNYHLLGAIDVSEPDLDIIKHMEQNNIPNKIAIETYSNLAKEYTKLFQEYGDEHQSLFSDEAKMRQVQSRIACQHVSDSNLYLLTFESMVLSIKITSDKYNRLQRLYGGLEGLFLFYLFEYAFNYYLLDGKSLQWSIPHNVFDYLLTLDLKGELFASPINHYHDFYFSLFFVDEIFGSKGNFFTFMSTPNNYLEGGLYEVNPPFIEEIFTESSRLLIEQLDNSKVPLGFIYIMPQWEDLFGYEFLINSRHFLGKFLLEKNRHSYFQSSNNKYILASFDTVVLLIGNKAFEESYQPALILKQCCDRFTISKSSN